MKAPHLPFSLACGSWLEPPGSPVECGGFQAPGKWASSPGGYEERGGRQSLAGSGRRALSSGSHWILTPTQSPGMRPGGKKESQKNLFGPSLFCGERHLKEVCTGCRTSPKGPKMEAGSEAQTLASFPGSYSPDTHQVSTGCVCLEVWQRGDGVTQNTGKGKGSRPPILTGHYLFSKNVISMFT